MHPVLNVVLCHQDAQTVGALLRHWRQIADNTCILIAHGGKRDDFAALTHPNKIFLDDPQLRTFDNQRERQSYRQIWQRTLEWLRSCSNPFEFVYVAEYDHLPLLQDLNARQMSFLEQERADILAYHLQRIDGTSHPHYLYHARDPDFHRFFSKLSMRPDRRVILSMFGSGSFWKRDVFEAVAATQEPFPIYLELFLPTVAHHLGFRLRSYGHQNTYVRNLGDRTNEIESARREGAWTLHPVKRLWTD
jgi:hypothetical protein